MEQKRYYTEINIARGIALLFVILGHSFPGGESVINKIVYNVCYSFHMGLFFILSGFVAANKLISGNYKITQQLKNKTIRLLVPYFIFSAVTLILKIFTEKFANNPFYLKDSWKILLGENPNGGLWFLWTLFMISAIYLFFGKLKHNLVYFAGFSVIAYIANLFLPHTFLSSILKYAIYYAIGIFVYKYYDSFKKHILRPVPSILMLVLFCAIHIFKFNAADLTARIPQNILAGDYLITCLSASIFILFISLNTVRCQSKAGFVYKVLNELGTYSYDIYLLSYFVQVPLRVIFKSIFPIPEYLLHILMFILGLVIPYLLSKFIIRKVPILNLLLFGNKKRTVKSNG